MVAVHEPEAVDIPEHAALAAHGLGQQELGRARPVERRGVELDKLEVHELRACAPGHGDAVTRGDRGDWWSLEEPSCAARGEQDGPGADDELLALLLLDDHRARCSGPAR